MEFVTSLRDSKMEGVPTKIREMLKKVEKEAMGDSPRSIY